MRMVDEPRSRAARGAAQGLWPQLQVRSLTPIALLALLALLLTPLAVHAQDEGPVIVTWETPDGSFMALLDDPAAIASVRAELAGGDSAGIPNGVILPGDGGVNIGHDWHLEQIELADITTEVCDATATYVDEHLDDFLALGRYCPWSAVVVAVVPADDPDNGDDTGGETTLPSTGAAAAPDDGTSVGVLILGAAAVTLGSLALRRGLNTRATAAPKPVTIEIDPNR